MVDITGRGILLFCVACFGCLTMACDDDGGEESPMTMVDQGMPDPVPEATPGCDPIMPFACALPWPSNLYLADDETRSTGYTLTFADNSLPPNVANDHVDPAPYARLDGYGLGTPILVMFPNLEITGIPGERSIADSITEDAPIVLLEVGPDGTRRIPYMAEFDSGEQDASQRALIIRPGEILIANRQYIVAFRGLVDTAGEPIAASEAFLALRDGATENWSDLSPRQERFDEVFARLEAEGIEKASLLLAWDFHTASTDALHGQLKHMWADALGRTGEEGPALVFDEIEEFAQADDDSGRPVHPYLALRIQGHVEVPEYVKRDEAFLGVQGWVLDTDDGGLAVASGVRNAPFWVALPHSALSGEPHRIINHGHGFFGTGKSVADVEWRGPCGREDTTDCGSYHQRLGNEYGYVTFSADMVGMSEPDRGEFALTLVTDFSKHTWISDYLHQGIVQNLLVTRSMKTQLASMPELVDRGVNIDAEELYFWGISMGSMFGATVMALSPDIRRGVFGVSGHNFSQVMDRSFEFEPFFAIMESTYPVRMNQLLVQATVQLLWDTTESISYMRHLSEEPFPGHEAKHLLADIARGDPAVPPVIMEHAVRSGFGLRMMENFDDERSIELVEAQAYPYTGSGLVNWHYGQPWAALGNQAPDEALGNPHHFTRQREDHHRQMDHFLRTGEIIDVCNGGTCPAAQ